MGSHTEIYNSTRTYHGVLGRPFHLYLYVFQDSYLFLRLKPVYKHSINFVLNISVASDACIFLKKKKSICPTMPVSFMNIPKSNRSISLHVVMYIRTLDAVYYFHLLVTYKLIYILNYILISVK